MPQKKILSNADSDLKNFSVGSTNLAQKFHGSADLHIPIHPPPQRFRGIFKQAYHALIRFASTLERVMNIHVHK